MSEAPATPLFRLIKRLAVTPLDTDQYVGKPGRGDGNVFGGMMAAQSVVAAGQTVTGASLHSLHGYFLRPGRYDVPMRFQVQRLRDGRTFIARTVVAFQGNDAIFTLAASFAKPDKGIAHQDPMPEAPGPEGLPDYEDLRVALLGGRVQRRADGPLEIRVCDPDSPEPGAQQPARRRVWIRPRGTPPNDPLIHAALVVFASDRTMLRTGARPHGLTWTLRVGASLDHAVWLHHVPRFDDWMLFVTESPAAHAARALMFGAMYRRDGLRIASVAQEGLLRA